MNSVAALLYGISGSTLVGLFLGFSAGGLNPLKAWLALLSGLAISLVALWQSRSIRSTPMPRPNLWGWMALGLFALFSLRAFLWLIFSNGNSLRVLSPNNLGDLSLHLCYIRQLACGAPFWPENPIYSGAPLSYPVGLDLFNSLLLLVGLEAGRGLIWVGLGCAVLIAVALWRWGGAFTVTGFLCNGGLLAYPLFLDWKVIDFQADAAWKSIPLALLVTQRGLLYALPAGLALLCSWRSRWFSKDPNAWRLPPWGQWLLYSTLPLFHIHSFLFLSLLLGLWFLIHRPIRIELLKFVGFALLPATALVFLVTGQFHTPSVLGWKPGWMQDNQNFFAFWFLNFGILPILLGALIFKLWKQKGPVESAALVAPALLIFLLCCFVKFAPWEWDNTKLMIWSYLLILPPLWDQLLVRWTPLPRALAMLCLFFSGFFSLLGGLDNSHQGHEIGLHSVLDGVSEAVRPLPLNERFVAQPTFNHPLLLAGRKLAMGYEGHVWSHGLDWAQRKAQVSQILKGEPNWRTLADQLEVRYLFWSPLEQSEFPDSLQPWRHEAFRCASGPWGEIFDLTLPAQLDSRSLQIEHAIRLE